MIRPIICPIRTSLRQWPEHGRILLERGRGRSYLTTSSRIFSQVAASRASSQPHATSNTTVSKEARAFPPLLLFGALLGGAIYYFVAPDAKSTTLNDATFVPYTITSREAISPTSFLLTITPQTPNPSLPYLTQGSSSWLYNLWSVEFKQPEVQIARHYTPLPPLAGDDPVDGGLRFYLRAVGGGEMSNYLSRLRVGGDVWLRGPHAGFDVAQLLGHRRQVVFLAGGTGVVPGMQVAKAVLDGNEAVTFSLLWAVRKREELQDAQPVERSWWQKVWRKNEPSELQASLEAPSPIARQLREMKAKYGDRLTIRVAIDEEGTFFRNTDIQAATDTPPVSSTSTSIATNQALRGKAPEATPAKLQGIYKPDSPNAESAGKNLFMVSGPEGFIEHYAGPKVWVGGEHTQGPVGGVAAQLQKQHPHLAKEWLVLKL